MMKEKEKRGIDFRVILVGAVLALLILSLSFLVAAPEGASSIDITSNQTKVAESGTQVNVSGGYLAAINITANVQNTKWKAFLGWVNGKFTLDDASGSTIYDWSLSVTSGRVYATRDSSTLSWGTIGCADNTDLENENTALSHTSLSDNITATFSDTTHNTFFVGATNIPSDTCPTLNTYQNNVSQDTDFEEMVLHDGTSIIYATIMENSQVGFDGNTYDFQMLVPEDGSSSWSGLTPYYLYVEIN